MKTDADVVDNAATGMSVEPEENLDMKLQIKEKIAKDGSISSADLRSMAGGSTGTASEPEAGQDAPKSKYNEFPEEDRKQFEEAVVLDKRFVKKYTLLDGKFTVTFRTRTMRESQAALQALRKYSDNTRLSNPETRSILDAALLALQVVELCGTDYPEVTGTLVPTVSEDGKKQDPEWYGRIEHWMDTPELRLNLVLETYREFENLYNDLCKEATLKNF